MSRKERMPAAQSYGIAIVLNVWYPGEPIWSLKFYKDPHPKPAEHGTGPVYGPHSLHMPTILPIYTGL